jgi:hypothetical protein
MHEGCNSGLDYGARPDEVGLQSFSKQIDMDMSREPPQIPLGNVKALSTPCLGHRLGVNSCYKGLPGRL